jgi:hypothetical protein
VKTRATGTFVAIAALAAAVMVWRGRPTKVDGPAVPRPTAVSPADTADGPRLGKPSLPTSPQVALALRALASARPNDGGGDLAATLERHKSMGERFEKEERDSAWAPVREKEVTDLLERDFAAGKQAAWVSSVRCHTTLCSLQIVSPSAADLEKAKLTLSYAPRASAIQFRGNSTRAGDEHVADFVLEFDGINRDPDAFADWQALARQTALEDLTRLRVGRSIPSDVPPPPPLSIPSDVPPPPPL